MIVIGVIFAALLILYVTWRVRYRYPPAGVPQVLCYHKLTDRFCLEGTWMTRRRFLDQIDRLVGAGYRFVDEDEYLAAVEDPPSAISKSILLTFDDGYEDLYEMYIDHLRPRGVPVLIFVVTGYVGQDNTWDLSGGRRHFRHLSWPQIATMEQAGARFGSHGSTHADLTRIDAAAIDLEIAGSKKTLESKLVTRVQSFSYPFGRYDSRIKVAVEAAGYTAAFSLYPRHSNEIVDRFALRRNGVYIIDTPRTIRWKLEPSAMYWFEEMKCRTINRVAVLTPVLKRFLSSSGPGSDPDK
jgi:peptidoglycan/xylan/chitin deacetylase (PgdA/CDA1 family)